MDGVGKCQRGWLHTASGRVRSAPVGWEGEVGHGGGK
jgi:hypothetical protein